jgi:pyruvate/2-oxoglutarate dehydrogenase complex dihydrolipoamide dehydrogenase (E3) component
MAEVIEVTPRDEHNLKLLANVHPPDWANPEPGERYNLVVVGAGTAGLVSAAGAAGLGARVALVERNLMGGDCLNVGCVPSKTLIRSARALADVDGAQRFGVQVPAGTGVDFAVVMERVRRIRAQISPHDSARRFRDEYGVDVFLGDGQFVTKDAVEVGAATIRFDRAVIATGARAAVPPVPGLGEAGFYTNETIFNLTEQPARLAVLGGGPIGCELAQTFARLGTRVTMIERGEHFLPREDVDAVAILLAAFTRDGVDVRLKTALKQVETKAGVKVLHLESDGDGVTLEADAILVGVGRAPNIEALGLEAAGVRYGTHGVEVNDHLQTSNPRIYAAGDVCSRYKFTHAADFMARAVVQNAFFGFAGKKKVSALTIPWCTYTDPEIAHVGMYEHDAVAKGIEVQTFVVSMSDVDRAIADGEEDGFVKVHVRKGSDEIVGATVVARHAGDMISELTTAIVGKLGLGTLASVIHPYPTQAEAIRKVGDAFNRTRLTPGRAKLLRRYFEWRL